MNYIKELNAFYELMEREPLSASAFNLWHMLLHINNKAAWIDEFTVPATVLKVKGGLTDSSFKRARKELEERGFIECQSTTKNMAPFYKMKRLYKRSSYYAETVELGEKRELDHDMNQQTNAKADHSANQHMDHQTDQQAAPLIKHKEIKKEIKPNENDAIIFYQENFGAVSPFLAEEILAWIEDCGDELVIEAMKRSLERGKFNFGYAKAILNSWVKQGIQTVEMLRKRESKAEGKGSGWNSRKARNDEVVPDWLLERRHKQKPCQVNPRENEEVDAQKMLKEYLASRVV